MAEDFATYSEVDPSSHITVGQNLLDINNSSNDEDAYVYKDRGASHFGATFEHDVKCTHHGSDVLWGGLFWAVSNVVEDDRYWLLNNSQAVQANWWRTDVGATKHMVRLQDRETAHSDTTASGFFEWDTAYYCTAERTSSTAIELRIYSDASRETLLDTLAIALTDGRTYQYILGCNTYNVGAAADYSYDVENLDLNELANIEDFTTYSEVADPSSWLTVTANKIAALNFERSADAWRGDDKGVDHFGATFEHDVKITPLAFDWYSLAGVWAVSNIVEDAKYWGNNDSQAVWAALYGAAANAPQFILREEEATAQDQSPSIGIGTPRYCTAERTGETTLQFRIYNDAARTDLFDTLAVALPNGRRYRYVFGCVSSTSPNAYKATFDVEDLNLNEAPAIVELAGSTAGTSAVSGAIDVAREIIGSAAGQSALAALLSVSREIVGSLAAQSIASSTLSSARKVAGSTAGVSTAVGTLGTIGVIKLAGAAAGVTSVEGSLSVVGVVNLAGSSAGTSALTAAIVLSMKLGGAVQALSQVGPLSLIRFWWPYVSLPDPIGPGRRLSWDTDETALVVVDGDILQEASGGQIDVDASQIVRQYLEILDELPGTKRTPLDVVALAWTGDALTYYVWRRQNGGDWVKIATTALLEYTDGPLVDADWDYKIEAVDDEGDAATSAAAELTVSSAPEPPSALDWSWASGTGTLTLTWAASPSSDVASYRVRSSAGASKLDLVSTPVQNNADLSYEQVFTDETGMWIFGVRAVDSDGNEEANISQVVAIPFESGAPTARPAEPVMVDAQPTAGGKIEVTWLYNPAKEYLGPGAAFEARIYWDAGTGTMDWDTPKATEAMGAPTVAAWYSWESEALTDDTEYLFGVRIATAADPAGIETGNTDEHAAIPDTSVPTAPTLAAQVL